jgi:hypothetical protein
VRATISAQKHERTLSCEGPSIPVLAWCNRPDGSNEFLNKRWQDYTGLSQEEAEDSQY